MASARKILVLFISWLAFSCCLAQEKDTSQTVNDWRFKYMQDSMSNRVYFHCGFHMKTSDEVNEMMIFVRRSRIKLIRSLLYSSNPAAQFLSLVLCEEMSNEKLIQLSASELVTIEQIKNSEGLIKYCQGCTRYVEGLPLKTIFSVTKTELSTLLMCTARSWAKREIQWLKENGIIDQERFVEIRDSYTNSIGFACGPEFSSTPSLTSLQLLMEESKVGMVRHLLYSRNASLQFLSVELCEQLKKQRLLFTTDEEEKQIAKIRGSKSITRLCSGCTFRQDVSLYDLWNSKDKDVSRIRKNVKGWAKDEVQTYKKAKKKAEKS